MNHVILNIATVRNGRALYQVPETAASFWNNP